MSKKDKQPSVLRDLAVTGALAIIALAVTVSAGWTVFNVPQPGEREGAISEAQIALIKSRDVIDSLAFTKDGFELIQYAYIGEELPEKLDPEEIVELRKGDSWTKRVGTEPDGRPILVMNIFPQAQYIERGGKWYLIEYDIVREKDFREAVGGGVSWLFVRVAHAIVSTLYSGAGDGSVLIDELNTSWASVHDSIGGTSVTVTTASTEVRSSHVTVKDAFWNITRAFFPFDTSTIPVASTINSVTLNLYATSTVTNTDNDGTDYLTVVQTSQPSSATLAVEDYDLCGAVSNPTEGIDTGERKDITSISTNAYVVFTLNQTGRDWIKKKGQTSNCGSTAGVTCIGVREGHDTTNASIALETTNSVYFSTSESTGTVQDPYLSVNYTPTIAFWQFQDY